MCNWRIRKAQENPEDVRAQGGFDFGNPAYALLFSLKIPEEACELGRQGVWGVEQVEREAREFLRLLTIEAAGEKGFDRSGHALRRMVGHWGGAILPEVQREFEKSAEWRRFTDELLAIAELRAGGAGSGAAAGAGKLP